MLSTCLKNAWLENKAIVTLQVTHVAKSITLHKNLVS